MSWGSSISRFTKLGGAAIAFALCVIWIASFWWNAVHSSRWYIAVLDGWMYVGKFQTRTPSTIVCELRGPGTGREVAVLQSSLSRAWPIRLSRGSGEWSILVPLWMPAVFAFGLSAVAWLAELYARRRHARGNTCFACGYSLVGLAAGAKCPECGKAGRT